MSDETDLLRRCAEGEDEAWREFLRRFGPFVDFIVRRALAGSGRGPVRQTHLEDVRDEVLSWLLEDDGRVLRTYRGDSKVTSWLGVVVGRRARRVARRRAGLVSRTVSFDALSEEAATHLAVDSENSRDSSTRESALERLAHAVDELPDRDKRLLRGAFFLERTYAELALELGLRPESIGQLLFRAKDKLRQRLGGARFLELLSGLAWIALISSWTAT
jgi:RNA polymerase sigma factor (sigma-70 family)